MAAFISANGRLGGNPTARTTPSGKTVCNASLAVTDGSDGETLWLKLVAWERQAEHLSRFKSGDSLAVVGKLALNCWTTREGEARRDLQVTVEQLIGGRPRPRKDSTPRDAGVPFDDKLEF